VLWAGIRWERLPQQLGYGSGMTCWRCGSAPPTATTSPSCCRCSSRSRPCVAGAGGRCASHPRPGGGGCPRTTTTRRAQWGELLLGPGPVYAGSVNPRGPRSSSFWRVGVDPSGAGVASRPAGSSIPATPDRSWSGD